MAMFSSGSSVFSVNAQAKALCSQRACKERNRFLVGTCSVMDENHIYVLEYRDDNSQLDQVGILTHPDQVMAIDSSYHESDSCVTCSQNNSGHFAVRIWKMPNQTISDIENFDINSSYDISTVPLEEKGEIKDLDMYSNHNVCWHSMKEQIAVTSSTYVAHVSVGESNNLQVVQRFSVDDGIEIDNEEYSVGVTAYDPHSSSLSATAFGSTFHVIDWRSNEVSQKISHAHSSTIRDIDYNPNRPMTLLTCGDDMKIKIWDLRNLSSPCISLGGHSHWIWSAKYNGFHDQLIVSGGSDSLVNLWRIASCSSAPWLGASDVASSEDMHSKKQRNLSPSGAEVGSSSTSEEPTSPYIASEDPPDVKVRSLDSHEESVFGLAWSSFDPWVFASLSYDGRVVINHVPSTEKYKILL